MLRAQEDDESGLLFVQAKTHHVTHGVGDSGGNSQEDVETHFLIAKLWDKVAHEHRGRIGSSPCGGSELEARYVVPVVLLDVPVHDLGKSLAEMAVQH